MSEHNKSEGNEKSSASRAKKPITDSEHMLPSGEVTAAKAKGFMYTTWFKLSIVAAASLVVAIVIYAFMQPGFTDNKQYPEIVKKTQKELPELQDDVRTNPEDSTARYKLGAAYYILDEKERAVTEYEKAVETNQQSAEYRNVLGNTYRDLGRYQEAVLEYKKGIELNKQYDALYSNLAYVQFAKQGDKDAAIETYDLAIKNTKNPITYLTLKGALYEQKGDTKEAIRTYNAILAQDKENKTAQAALKRLQ